MDQPMSQEELLEALAEQTCESGKFWKLLKSSSQVDFSAQRGSSSPIPSSRGGSTGLGSVGSEEDATPDYVEWNVRDRGGGCTVSAQGFPAPDVRSGR